MIELQYRNQVKQFGQARLIVGSSDSHVEPVAEAQYAPSHYTKQGVTFEVLLPLDRSYSFRQGQRFDGLGVPVGSGLALVNLPSCQMLDVIENSYRKTCRSNIVRNGLLYSKLRLVSPTLHS